MSVNPIALGLPLRAVDACKRLTNSLLLATSLGVPAFATEAPPVGLPEPWPEIFGLTDAALPGTDARVDACLGIQRKSPATDSFSEEVTQKRFQNETRVMRTVDGGAVAIARDGRWACVRMTAQGFPIWPLEALHARAEPTGVSPASLRAFREALLREVAVAGLARGIVTYGNGNAAEITVLAKPKSGSEIRVTNRHLKAGSFQPSDYAIVLAEPATSLVSQERSARPDDWRLVLPIGSLYWPVDGEFAVIPPTRFTEAAKLIASRWTTQDGRSLSLLDGGIAAVASRGDSQTGNWVVEEDVLRVRLHNGIRYSLTLTADLLTLEGVLRRKVASGWSGDQGEFQSIARFSRAP